MICRLAAFVTLLLSSSFVFAAPAERLNIVLFLADDLGWADVGCYGADLHETPHLDRLARQSLRFTQAYAGSSVCTPTRAALMTGKHPARLGMTIWAEAAKDPPPPKRLVPPPAEHNLSRSETTVASYLSKAGYLTAIVGKWHLGDALHYPETHGFDVNIGGTLWGAPHTHFYPYRGGGRFGREYRYVPHLEFGQPGEYLTDRLTDESLHVIDRAGDRPFFLYLAHHAVHTPIEAKADDVAHFEQKLTPSFKHQNATYAAMVRSLDESVGRVLQRLDERGLTERTLFIFTSDNGGFIGRERAAAGPVTNNHPLRSGKGALYEGGVRVPLMVRWPGVTPAGGESAEPVISEDLFFTILEAAGVKPSADAPADGLSLVPILKDPGQHLPREALYFHYPHYYHTTTPVSSVRAGDWKLLEFYEDGHRELYNLADDLGEERDLARQQPDRTSKLADQLAAWRKEVGARLPQPAAGTR
ncbi:MAG TPA: sulfatase [Pirellulales bacterium]|nr:sulfatase [Pirellulales bacterium]